MLATKLRLGRVLLAQGDAERALDFINTVDPKEFETGFWCLDLLSILAVLCPYFQAEPRWKVCKFEGLRAQKRPQLGNIAWIGPSTERDIELVL